jgi:hypothetical protein
MNTLKLNKLSNNNLDKISGGRCTVTTGGRAFTIGCGCGCACIYANAGGASDADNRNANSARGLCSPCIISGECTSFSFTGAAIFL